MTMTAMRASTVALAVLVLAGCSGLSHKEQRALTGGAIGAAGGALGGALIGGSAVGGAVLGGGAGAALGYLTDLGERKR
jgi:osmotically inducible lipoprotein OsmB